MSALHSLLLSVSVHTHHNKEMGVGAAPDVLKAGFVGRKCGATCV